MKCAPSTPRFRAARALSKSRVVLLATLRLGVLAEDDEGGLADVDVVGEEVVGELGAAAGELEAVVTEVELVGANGVRVGVAREPVHLLRLLRHAAADGDDRLDVVGEDL